MKYLIAICLAAAAVMPAQAQTEDFSGKVFTAKGVVLHQKAGSDAWGVVEAPYLIEPGDKVRTGPEATAEIYIKYGTKVRLGGGTTFIMKEVTAEANTLELMVGKMQAWVRKAVNRRVTVRTPSAVCAIRGTVLEAEVTQTGETVWNLFSGSMQVSNPANTISRTMLPNQTVTVSKDAAVISEPAPLPAEVKPPAEPKKIKEEKAEIKAEEKAAKEQPKTEEVKKEEVKAEEVKTEEAAVEEPPVPAAPVTEPSVIPTQEVQESQAVSGSNP